MADAAFHSAADFPARHTGAGPLGGQGPRAGQHRRHRTAGPAARGAPPGDPGRAARAGGLVRLGSGARCVRPPQRRVQRRTRATARPAHPRAVPARRSLDPQRALHRPGGGRCHLGSAAAGGVSGGRVLEPGCGSGTFIGHAPESAVMVGVENDAVTAAIAATLYPSAQIRNEGFEATRVPENSFAAAVGNVPFGALRRRRPRPQPAPLQHPQPLHLQIAGADRARRLRRRADQPLHPGLRADRRAARHGGATPTDRRRCGCRRRPSAGWRAPMSSPTC